jgi:hypothetical protein
MIRGMVTIVQQLIHDIHLIMILRVPSMGYAFIMEIQIDCLKGILTKPIVKVLLDGQETLILQPQLELIFTLTALQEPATLSEIRGLTSIDLIYRLVINITDSIFQRQKALKTEIHMQFMHTQSTLKAAKIQN